MKGNLFQQEIIKINNSFNLKNNEEKMCSNNKMQQQQQLKIVYTLII